MRTGEGRPATAFLCESFTLYKEVFHFMAQEQTLIILKPDAVQRGLIGPILTRLEQRGLKLVGLKLMQINEDLARKHYAAHEGKPFFPGLVEYITSGPVVVGVIEGKDAVQVVRNTMGATNPASAAPGTIRGDFAVEIGRNLIHGSDSPESGAREVALFFKEEELVRYERSNERWIRE
ncbi:MAG: nucleoside diphosphate kinase [Herpetosiphonaceae bacterium]|nr:MAG: nucleoside diphosphate kinase [Herpetosiphonaceae bacterium]